MRSSYRRVIGLGIAAVGLMSCGGSNTAPEGQATDGTWRGGQASNDITFQLTMTLAEQGGNITGNGHASSNTVDCDVSIVGTRTGATVHLSIGCQGYIPVGFTGHEDNPTTITGHISGSGFPSTEFDLLKQ